MSKWEIAMWILLAMHENPKLHSTLNIPLHKLDIVQDKFALWTLNKHGAL